MWWFDGREGDTENLHTRASHPKRCNTVNLANRAYTRKFSLRALFVGFVVVRWLLYYAHVTLHSMDIPNIEKLSIRFMIIKFKCKRWCVYVFLFLFPRWWQREKKKLVYYLFCFRFFGIQSMLKFVRLYLLYNPMFVFGRTKTQQNWTKATNGMCDIYPLVFTLNAQNIIPLFFFHH